MFSFICIILKHIFQSWCCKTHFEKLLYAYRTLKIKKFERFPPFYYILVLHLGYSYRVLCNKTILCTKGTPPPKKTPKLMIPSFE